MARLGISIYPEHASLEENIDYFKKQQSVALQEYSAAC